MIVEIFPIRRRFALLLVALVALFAAVAADAQRAAVRSNPKNRRAAQTVRLREKKSERERDRTPPKIDWKQNAARIDGPTVVLPMKFGGESPRLADLARRKLPPVSKENGPLFENETERITIERDKYAPESLLPDPVQNYYGPAFAATVGTSFDAVTAAGLAPPDTTLAVGPNHIIVWVNSRYAVYNKSGTLLLGPVGGNTLFTGMGNLCATTNRGDPILQYDRAADRWILSQFAFNVSGPDPASPYLQCFAVSTTNDPTGTWYRYSVTFSPVAPSGFNDYGKLGIWPDAYYTSYNMFEGSPAGNYSGSALCASDRTKMLAGDGTATTLCAPVAIYAADGFLPADLDGPTAPVDATQGGLFIGYSTAPALRLYKLKPDFVNSTVTLTDGLGGGAGTYVNIPLPATTLPCNGTGGTCVAQPGTANTLDTLGDRLMYRAAYRNRGGTDSLVLAQSVDPDGAGARSAAMRWYEIRSPFSATPSLYQAGTFDEGGTGDRWMGSVAMNKDGDMLMGYSIVNAGTNLKPSIALTGRRLADPLNAMQTEQIVLTGSGSQTGTLTRWGDYTTVQTDPADDQTFCFIGQYLLADGAFNWRTRVVCAKFPAPTAALVAVTGRVTDHNGTAIARARLTLADAAGNQRSAVTNSFGYYRFDAVAAGAAYTVAVAAKGYEFAPSSVVVDVADAVTNLDFAAR
ncbi:MAG: carboxypeptidase regulatory-like domain-containing protein [Acidobacteria bacterium]|nr:carboxypeptidase regulatory-like domain-containing protein [Acidobacteriota bacterium]